MPLDSLRPMTDIRLWVIVPIYGNWEDTLECLAALGSQSTGEFHVLIADDGSPSPPPVAIHTFTFAHYLRNPHRGFAGNCNVAAAEAIRRGATHILFLNNDTVFSCHFIQGWLQIVTQLPDAILSPLIYWFNKPSAVWYSGGNLTVWVPFFRTCREYEALTEVDLVSGCALLVPIRHWRQLGGFDEAYITYFEDLDFTLRARKRGVRIYVVPDARLKVRHRVSGSFKGQGAWNQQYLLITSRLIFTRTHYHGLRKYLSHGLNCAHLIVFFLLNLPEVPRTRLLWNSMVQGFAARSRL